MDSPKSTGTPASVGVDREMCQTAATCLAYGLYELDDESKAVLLTSNGSNSDDPNNPLATADGFVKLEDLASPNNSELALKAQTPEGLAELVMESAKSCPFNAIIVKDENGTQLWPL